MHIKKLNQRLKAFTMVVVALFAGALAAIAQNNQQVSGRVLDASNKEPLVGASILVEGTTIGTTTNNDGTFKLNNIPAKSVLLVSFTGYATERVPVNGNKNLSISLSAEKAKLNEVVVVGYGSQKKKDVVGAVSTVKGDAIVQSNAPSLSNSLAGRVSGLIALQRSAEPGDDASELLIRGRATLNGNDPLIMVDGIQRDFNQIDPNEIATISVLKDASATAIYGTRGANGVILVTTKRGVASKPTFNYTSYAGSQNVINIPDYLNSYDFARLYNLAQQNDDPSLTPSQLQYTADDLQKYQDHSAPFTHPDIQWYKAIIKPDALQQRHSLSMSGGSDKFRYFALFGYFDQDAIYRSTNLGKYNGRLNIDADITKTTTVSITAAGDFSKTTRPGTGGVKDDGGIFSLVVYLPPNAFPVTNQDGTFASLWGANPIGDLTVGGKRQEIPVNLQSTVTVNQKLDFLTKGLSAKIIAAHDFGYHDYNDFYTPYLSYNSVTGEEYGGDNLPALYQGFSKYFNNTFETHLNYTRTFGKSEVTALGLYTQTGYYSNNIDASRTDYAFSALPQLFVGPRTNINNNGGASEAGREGYLGRLSYSFDKRYFIEGSFGYNGSQNFPPGKRFGFFPAGAIGWNMKGEKFMQNVDLVSTLKLRASHGEVGNDNVGYRSFLYRAPVYFDDNYVFGGPTGTPVQTIYSGELANPDVTWERAKKTNFGVDLGLKNDKLTGTVDVFFENRNNILAQRNQAVPGTFGASLPVENIASVKNKGLEFTLDYRGGSGELTYYTTLNYTLARNKITFIDEAANIPSYQQRTGYPIGQFYGYVSEGLYQTQKQIDELPKIVGVDPKLGQLIYKDVNSDGVIDNFDVTAIGRSATPENLYGLTVGFGWKGFDLTMLWQGAFGYNAMRTGESFSEFNYGGSALTYIKNNWTPDNPNATYPRLSLSDYNYKQEESTYWLRQTAYLRLKNLELGHNFSEKFLKSNFISKLRVYVTGTNLLTFSKEKDFDPESASGYPYYYPVTNLKSIGVNLTF